jgi:acyl-CoA synthetase (AMP-forming)/AMP-acid ligase II
MEPDFDRHDLSAWTVGLFGGAIMPPAVIATLAEKLPKLELINAYGATETTSPATIMPPGLIHATPDSIGKTVPCGEIRIMDDAGREVATGEPGELWINGPMVAQGYWNNAAATRENFVAGFWRSGDIGSIDANGFVRVFDRKKDMINRAGYKVFSAEVENALNYHPDVVECIVVPSPDPVLGERVHAFVCARREQLSSDELRAFCLLRIADYKVPDRWTIGTEPLPRNANGKFQKAVMRDEARRMAEARP